MLKQTYHMVQELFYRNRYNVFIKKLKKHGILPNVTNSLETVNHLTAGAKSFARFGDGEFVWIQQKSFGSFQHNSKELSLRLKEVLNSEDPNLMIGIPKVFDGLHDFDLDARLYWERELVLEGDEWVKMLPRPRVFFDTQTTRPYMDYRVKSKSHVIFEAFKGIWNNRQVVIVEGRETRFGVGNDLLSGVDQVRRIECPEVNAFDFYESILTETVDVTHDMVNPIVLAALGPTATVLAFDLQTKFNIQTIDIGHLDVEYSWMMGGATNKVSVTGKYVNEVPDGNSFQKEFDNEILKPYFSQVVKVIGSEKV